MSITLNILDAHVLPLSADLTPAIQATLAKAMTIQGAVTLSLPKGSYHVWPEQCPEKFYYVFNNGEGIRRMLFPIIGMHDLTIDGNGSTLMIHGRLSPFIVDNSARITIRNLTINCPRPFFTQGTILDSTTKHVDLRIDASRFPHRVENGRFVAVAPDWVATVTEAMLQPFDPTTRAPTANCPYYCGTFDAEIHPDRVVRLLAPLKRPFRTGDILTIGHEGRTNAGISITESRQVLIENVTIHHVGGMGVVGQLSEDVTLRRVRITPEPNTDRMISTNADATHFVHCTGTVTLDDCVFEGMLDDATNVHGIYALVGERRTPDSLDVIFQRGDQLGYNLYRPGDVLTFADRRTLHTFHQAEVKASRLVEPNRVILEFAEPLPDTVAQGTAVNTPDRMPDLLIRNCRTGNNRPRGFLVATPKKAIIEGCLFYNSLHGINITADACDWFESGPVSDVTIRNNTFRNCCYAEQASPIEIVPHFTAPRTTDAPPYNRAIRIEDNTFEHFDDNLICVHATANLVIKGNHLHQTTTYPRRKPCQAVDMADCANAVVERIRIEKG